MAQSSPVKGKGVKSAFPVNGRRVRSGNGRASHKRTRGDNPQRARRGDVIIRFNGQVVARLGALDAGSPLRLDVDMTAEGTGPVSADGRSVRCLPEQPNAKDPAWHTDVTARKTRWYTMTELNQHTRDVMDAIETSGTPAVITRQGRPVATISPIQAAAHESYGRWLVENLSDS